MATNVGVAVILGACGTSDGVPSAGPVSQSDAVQRHSLDARNAVSQPPAIPRPSPAAQAWGTCGNIRDEADARDLVASGQATSLVEAQVGSSAIESYEVLAGEVSGLRTLDNVMPPPGRYLLLLGGSSPDDHYAALGYYGVYRVDGEYAYQMCAYGAPEVTRGGVTDLDGIVELLRQALRE